MIEILILVAIVIATLVVWSALDNVVKAINGSRNVLEQILGAIEYIRDVELEQILAAVDAAP